jgi:hypothetical protein
MKQRVAGDFTMINRRQFIRGMTGVSAVAGSALGSGSVWAASSRQGHAKRAPWLSAYEKKLAASPDLKLLGIPKSWWHVHQGFHPFTPERTVIVKPTPEKAWTKWEVEQWTRRLVAENVAPWNTNAGEIPFSQRKLELMLRIVKPMASVYRDKPYFEEWMLGLARREALGSSGLGRHVGLVHQFQKFTQPRTVNGLVDWWLFLIPNGGEFESPDGEPVHLLFGHVFPNPAWEPAFSLDVLCLLSRAIWSLYIPEIMAFSKLDRQAAARCINQRLAKAL